MSNTDEDKKTGRKHYVIERPMTKTPNAVPDDVSDDSPKSTSNDLKALLQLIEAGYQNLGQRVLISSVKSVQAMTQSAISDAVSKRSSAALMRRVQMDDDEL